jgi:hypothetical protein
MGQKYLTLLGGKAFLVIAPVTLTFDLMISKSIGAI